MILTTHLLNSSNLHPWLSINPHAQEIFLKNEFTKNTLLSRISTIAISAISLSASLAAFFSASKPAILLLMGLALTSPLLFYFSSTFSKQAESAEKNFLKMKGIRLELDKLKDQPQQSVELELKPFQTDPHIPWECKLTILARLHYLQSQQNNLHRNISELSSCHGIVDRKIKLWQRCRAWDLYTKEYLPIFIEKAFCHYILRDPFYKKFPWQATQITMKDFLEFSFDQKYDQSSTYLCIPHQNDRTLSLDEFAKLTETLSSEELSYEIFN